jgi:hypothetical protein
VDSELLKQKNADAAKDLKEQAQPEEVFEQLTSEDTARFDAVVRCMRKVLAPSPELELDSRLAPEDARAMEKLWTAKMGRDVHTGGFVSAFVRTGALNAALTVLQPVLALGLLPEFADSRDVYQSMEGKVAGLRQELKQRAMLEAVGRNKRKKKPVDKKDDDPNAPDDTVDADELEDELDDELDEDGADRRRDDGGEGDG